MIIYNLVFEMKKDAMKYDVSFFTTLRYYMS